MSNEKIRAEFEAWAKSQGFGCTLNRCGDYGEPTAGWMWTAWQAARAQPAESGLTQVDMGFGKFAVGGCWHPESKIPGIIYLHLRDARPLGTDTTDVYPVGSQAQPNDIAGLVYFHNAFAIQQTIDVLLELQREHHTPPPSLPARRWRVMAWSKRSHFLKFMFKTWEDGKTKIPVNKLDAILTLINTPTKCRRTPSYQDGDVCIYCGKTILDDFDESTPAQMPNGWQLVPKMPTAEMLGRSGIGALALQTYHAMLAAAPQPKGWE